MSESPAPPAVESPPSAPPTERAGWSLWFRLFAVATVPLLLLAVTGVLLTRSLAIGGLDLSTPEFQIYFLGALLLAAILGTLLATWLHLAIRSRLLALHRALAEEQTGEIRGLELEDGWDLLSDVAREASELLSRSHEARSEAQALAELRDQLDALIAGLEEWAATESHRGFSIDERLGPLGAAVETLRARLEERDAEAHATAVQTLDTARDGRTAVELAVRESKKSALEASFLRKDLSVLRLELAEAMKSVSAPGIPSEASSAVAAAAEAEEAAALVDTVRDLRNRLEEEERRALSLALVLAASRLKAWGGELGGSAGESRGAGPAGSSAMADPSGTLVGTLSAAAGGLREVALACRTLGEEVRSVESKVAGWAKHFESAAHHAPDPAARAAEMPGTETLRDRLAAIEQRGERLVALCERAERHAAQAVLGTRAVEDDLGGLVSRFEPPAPPENPGDGETGSAAPSDAARLHTGPLRLLTREDVVPEEGQSPSAGTADTERAPDASGKPQGEARGDVW